MPIHFLYDNYTFIDKWNWDYLSKNEGLPWTEEFIEKYEKKWSWAFFPKNEALPWTEEFIEKYNKKYNNSLYDYYNLDLLSLKGLPWSIKLIDQYSEYIMKIYNDLEECNRYHDLNSVYGYLFSNQSVWEKAFKPYVTDKMIEEVMERTVLE